MKKGISLIVLVITIIVMIIIAGAIIISLNSSNVINQADNAVAEADIANAKSLLAMKYAESMANKYDDSTTTEPLEIDDYEDALEGAGFDMTKYEVVLDGERPVLTDKDGVTL